MDTPKHDDPPLDAIQRVVYLPSLATVVSSGWTREPQDHTWTFRAQIQGTFTITDREVAAVKGGASKIAEDQLRKALKAACDGPLRLNIFDPGRPV